MARKIVDVPFVYKADYVPPRARNERTTSVRDAHGVIVRDLSPDEFPVALRVSDAMAGEKHGQIDDIRFDGVGLYRPFAYETAQDRTIVGADALDRIQPYDELSTPFGRTDSRKVYGQDVVRRADVPGRITSDNRDKIIGQIEKIASQTVICDDQIYVRCTEPCYRFVNGGFNHSYFRVEFVDPQNPTKPETVIRADRLDEYVAAKYPERDPPGVYGHLECLMPEVLRLSVAGPALIAASESVKEAISRYLVTASIEEFGAYAALRDSLAKCGGTVDEDLLAAVDSMMDFPKWAEKAGWVQLPEKREAFRVDLLRGTETPRLGMG